VLIAMGRVERALQDAVAYAAAQPQQPIAIARLAEAMAANGNVSGGRRVLDNALTARESNSESAGVNPYFRALRGDRRWPAFALEHRLPTA
jgi:predicted Zn-dependent protease